MTLAQAKPALVRLCAGGIAVVLLTAAYHRADSASVMTQTANHFLASLTPEQKTKATFDFANDERLDWHFIPKERKGLPLREMTPAQQHLATALLGAGLSQQGLIKAESIMSLEDVLRILENDDGEHRNPMKYYFTVFGTPSDSGTWGYRVEGHHLSQNFTVSGGRVVSTPSFFGANPAEVKQGPRAGLRILAEEEDLGRDLLKSLDAGQQKTAIVSADAYKDILTGADRKAALTGQPSGLSGAQMRPEQFDKLLALVEMYANNMAGQLAQARMDQVRASGRNIYFAWAGSPEKGGPHYYRVQSPVFLIEYDDTQNNSNHIHTVWRDFNGDFGLDLLKQHYQTSHP